MVSLTYTLTINTSKIASNEDTHQMASPLWTQYPNHITIVDTSTGENDLTRRVTHREAVFGTVIHSIFDAWHYESPMDLRVD